MRAFFIAGTGTGVGKTLLTCALAHQARQAGKSARAIKPVISGYDPADANSDTAQLLLAQGLKPDAVEQISPWRFAQPLSPNIAARRENRPLKLSEISAFCHNQPASDLLLVESAGGVATPLNDEGQTMADWAQALGWPVILVTSGALGTLSITHTAFDFLRARGLNIAAVVCSESAPMAGMWDELQASFRQFIPSSIPLMHIAPLSFPLPLWHHMPPLLSLIGTSYG